MFFKLKFETILKYLNKNYKHTFNEEFILLFQYIFQIEKKK